MSVCMYVCMYCIGVCKSVTANKVVSAVPVLCVCGCPKQPVNYRCIDRLRGWLAGWLGGWLVGWLVVVVVGGGACSFVATGCGLLDDRVAAKLFPYCASTEAAVASRGGGNGGRGVGADPGGSRSTRSPGSTMSSDDNTRNLQPLIPGVHTVSSPVPQLAKDVFAEFDRNSDGRWSRVEFMRWSSAAFKNITAAKAPQHGG